MSEFERRGTADQGSKYCGYLVGSRVQLPALMTLKYVWPTLFFTDVVVVTRAAASSRGLWGAATTTNTLAGVASLPILGFGLPIRPLIRRDWKAVTREVERLVGGDTTTLTSARAVEALRHYAHVIRNTDVTRLRVEPGPGGYNKVLTIEQRGRPARVTTEFANSWSTYLQAVLEMAFGERLQSLQN